VALCKKFAGLVSATDLVKSSKNLASLVVCTRLNIFVIGGCRFFVIDVISGGHLNHLGQLHLALGPNC